jgi:hypothetical protein
MKRNFYLVGLVLCLFGNVACADYLDKLLSSNAKYSAIIKKSTKTDTVGVKVVDIFDTSKKKNPGFKKNDLFYKGRLSVKKRDFASTDWDKKTGDEKEKAENSIQATEDKLHYVEVQIASYGAHRKALLTAFRFNLPNLEQLIEDYVNKFFK